MGMTHAYKSFTEILQGKWSLGRAGYTWENNIEVNFQEIRVQRRALD
jgi:hypothetical protein